MSVSTKAGGEASSAVEQEATAGGSSRMAVGLAAALGFVLGLLALGPGLAPGFLLSYDMVFVPDPPFSAALLGASGGPARAVPSDAVITVAARLMPADMLQKLILLAIFTAACSGAAALLAAGWQAASRQGAIRRPAPVAACLVTGCFYVWNPFVAERLLIGQWALLLGYAGLPWVLREVCAGPVRIRPGRLLLVMLPAAVGGFAAMAVTGLAAVPTALARKTGQPWRSGTGRRLATVLAALALLSLPWLIPSVFAGVHTDPQGVDVFAARPDTPFGRLGSLTLLSGIWNDQTVPRGYGGAGSYFWLLVVVCALLCYLLVARPRRMWPGLGAAGLIGLAIAAIGITSPTRALLRDLVAAWPGFAILRDGQQFVAALALTEAIGFGAGVAWLISRTAAARAGETGRLARPSPQPAATAIAVLAILAPLVLLPGMAWGLAGRIRPAQYPADWIQARRIIDGNPQRGSVLVLPWAAYRRYPWNGGEAVYDPWNKLLSREVISNDGLQVGRLTLAQESPASIRLNQIVTARGPLTSALRAAGVRYVVVDAGPILTANPSAAASDARLPGALTVLASHDLVVFELPRKT